MVLTEKETLYVLVEDTVPEEQKESLKSACEAFAKRLNLQNVNLFFLNGPSELELSDLTDLEIIKNLFNEEDLLISKSEPCLSWFERTCIIPRRKDGKPVPRYISVQPKLLFPDEEHCSPGSSSTVFVYPSFSKIAKFKGAIILCDKDCIPSQADFDLLAEYFENKSKKTETS